MCEAYSIILLAGSLARPRLCARSGRGVARYTAMNRGGISARCWQEFAMPRDGWAAIVARWVCDRPHRRHDAHGTGSARDEYGARGAAVGAEQLEREAHERVLTGVDASEVEPLDDNDLSLEECMVSRTSSGAVALDRQEVDADETDVSIDDPPGPLGRERDIVGGKVLRHGAPVHRVSCLEEHALYRVPWHRRFQIPRADRLCDGSENQHLCRPDQGV